MSIEYSLVFRDGFGNVLHIVDNFTTLEYTRVVNKIGAMKLVLPDQWDSRLNLSTYDIYSAIDGTIEIWRQIDGGAPHLAGETVWFVRKPVRILQEKGQRLIELTAVDAIELLARRFTGGGQFFDQVNRQPWATIDDYLKAVVTVAFLSDGRSLPPSIFSVQTITSQWSSAGHGAPGFWRSNIYAGCLANAEAEAAGQGRYAAFDIVYVYNNHLQFRTYTNQRGNDHRFPQGTAGPLIIDPEMGNLALVTLASDWSEEWNHATVIAAETEMGFYAGVASDSARIGLSAWNRREMWRHHPEAYPNQATANALAAGLLREGRPRQTFAGRLLTTPAFQYGKHFGFGDIVVANYLNRQYNVRLDAMQVRVDSGPEAIDVVVKHDEVLD